MPFAKEINDVKVFFCIFENDFAYGKTTCQKQTKLMNNRK